MTANKRERKQSMAVSWNKKIDLEEFVRGEVKQIGRSEVGFRYSNLYIQITCKYMYGFDVDDRELKLETELS